MKLHNGVLDNNEVDAREGGLGLNYKGEEWVGA